MVRGTSGTLITSRGEQSVDVLLIKNKYFYGKGEFIVMNKDLCNFLKSKNSADLTALDFRVLMTLIDRSDANNRIRTFKQKILAEELGTSQANISRSLKRLVNLGIIELKELDYYFNKKFIYTGGKDGKIQHAEEIDGQIDIESYPESYTYGSYSLSPKNKRAK